MRNLIQKIKDVITGEDKYFKVDTMTAMSARIVLGIVPGFQGEDYVKPSMDEMRKKLSVTLNTLCGGYHVKTGMYISFTVTSGTVHYNQNWGCPRYGEDVFILEAVQNPIYPEQADKNLWMKTVEFIADDLRRIFQQEHLVVEYKKEQLLDMRNEEDNKKCNTN